MPTRTPKKERISVSVTPQQKRKLQKIASQAEVSVSRVVQEAVKRFIESHGNLSLLSQRK
jgi:predicted transcriptional regulator